MSTGTPPDHRGELFAALQRLLPQHTLSRLLGRLADSRRPGLKNFLIRQAIARYGIDLGDAQQSNIEDYPSFNHFFTRALKPGARPVDQNTNRDATSRAGARVSDAGLPPTIPPMPT